MILYYVNGFREEQFIPKIIKTKNNRISEDMNQFLYLIQITITACKKENKNLAVILREIAKSLKMTKKNQKITFQQQRRTNSILIK